MEGQCNYVQYSTKVRSSWGVPEPQLGPRRSVQVVVENLFSTATASCSPLLRAEEVKFVTFSDNQYRGTICTGLQGYILVSIHVMFHTKYFVSTSILLKLGETPQNQNHMLAMNTINIHILLFLTLLSTKRQTGSSIKQIMVISYLRLQLRFRLIGI